MRYRVHPRFWDELAGAGYSLAQLSRALGYSRQTVYRIRRVPVRSVSEAFREKAVALFLPVQRVFIHSLFIPIAETERYLIRPAFWGLLAVRNVKKVWLAQQIGMAAQQLSGLRRNPTWSVSREMRDRICTALDIEDDYYFMLDPHSRVPRQFGTARIAS